jgi:signal transduction histidine kinase
MEEALRAIIMGRESGYGEYTAIRLDGSNQDFIYRWAISRQPGSGKPARMVLAATDVTELRQAEAALERQLRERDQFVASVSHELRTPLTSVLGLTEELVGRPEAFDAVEQGELLGIVHAETQDVVDIVEDLLVTARAESGQLQVNVTSCDLTAEMNRVSELMGGEVLPGSASITVGADPVRLRQVMRNLVSNAHRHGGSDIRMGVARNGKMASFEIRDDGDPLPHSERERIFRAYERSGEGGVVGSVGLGLHVARLLARLMGGDLTYDHDGNDSIFRLTLPVAAAVAAGSPAD